MSGADAQTVIVNDSFADGITALAPDQLNWNTTSSNAALDVDQAPGPVDFASGDSGRSIHAIFPAQSLTVMGDVLNLTFDFTTPTSITYDGGTNGETGSGSISTNEDFKFGLFDTSTVAGVIDDRTGLPIDFNGPVNTNSGMTNPGLIGIAGFQGEIDNINQTTPSADLGIRTHNANSDLSELFPSGQLLQTNDGFQLISGGADGLITLLPDTDYTGVINVEFTDATLLSLDITIAILDAAGGTIDSHTASVDIADDPGVSVGVNTTTFDMFALHATTGAFGGTVGPTAGSSAVGEANNGIDISNVTITFTDGGMAPIKGDVDTSGTVDFADIGPFIAVLQGGMFQAEADCDCSTVVDFSDIPAFIAILQGQ